jgi:hypothetical protein
MIHLKLRKGDVEWFQHTRCINPKLPVTSPLIFRYPLETVILKDSTTIYRLKIQKVRKQPKIPES